MYPRFKNGEVLVCAEIEHDPNSLIGDDVYVKLTDGRRLVKELRRGTKPGLFTLKSYTEPDIEDVAIEAAYRVEWIRPRAPKAA